MNTELCTNILQPDKPKESLMYIFYWNDVLHRTKMHHIYTQLNLITK